MGKGNRTGVLCCGLIQTELLSCYFLPAPPVVVVFEHATPVVVVVVVVVPGAHVGVMDAV